MSLVLSPKPPASIRQAKFRKRFLLISIAGLAVLGPALGVSYLGDSGTVVTSISGTPSSSLVYTSSLPCDIFGGNNVILANGTPGAYSSTSCTATPPTPVLTKFTPPSWSPTANSAGSVTTAGDLALVDMSAEPSATTAIVNVYITNLQGLASDYSSFALPINVYSCASGCTTAYSSTVGATNPWTPVTGASSFVTNTNGSYSISLKGGAYYDITIDSGGEYYCVSTSTSTPASLAPQFFVTAQLT